MNQFPFLHSFFQPTEGGVVAQSTKHLHFLGVNEGVFFEIFSQLAINLDLTDCAGTSRVLGADEFGAAQFTE